MLSASQTFCCSEFLVRVSTSQWQRGVGLGRWIRSGLSKMISKLPTQLCPNPPTLDELCVYVYGVCLWFLFFNFPPELVKLGCYSYVFQK